MNPLKKAALMAQSRMAVAMATRQMLPIGVMDSDGDGDGDMWSPQISKPAAHYRPAVPCTINRCASCMHFMYDTSGKLVEAPSTTGNPVQSAGGTCDMVQGDVASDGVCDIYSPMPKHDSADVDIRNSDAAGRY